MIAALLLAAAFAAPPRPHDFLTDNAGALGASAAASIRSELQSYNASTGNTVLVWIGQTTGGVPLEDWTVHTAEQWRVGRKGKDNGAVLFLFMRDRKIRIEVGYGLESSLTDANAGEIIRNTITPKMRAGDVDGAVQSGVDAMLVAITPAYADKLGHSAPAPSESTSSSRDPGAIGFIIVIVLLAFVLMLTAGGKGKHGAWYWGGWMPMGGFGGYSGGGGGGGFSGGFGGGFGGGGASGGW